MKQLIHFTDRECDVLELLCEAKSRKVIAFDLGISINTLDKHIHSIHIKTNSHSVAELMKWIEKNWLVYKSRNKEKTT